MPLLEPTQAAQSQRSRWQYSLRWLLGATTAISVVLATFGSNWWWDVLSICTLALLLGLLATFALIVVTPSLLCRGGISKVAAAGATAALGIVAFAILNVAMPSPLTVFRAPLEYLPLGGLPLCVTAWLMRNVLRRTPIEFDRSEVGRAAASSLLTYSGLYAYAVFIAVDNENGVWRGGSDPQRFAIDSLAFVASLATAIPWFILIRRRAMFQSPRWSAFDFFSLALLAGSLITVVLWFLLRLVPQSFTEKGDLGSVLGLLILTFYALPVGSCLFVAAALIEIWRDRWHRWLTLMSGTFFASYWLLWAFEPGLTYLPLPF